MIKDKVSDDANIIWGAVIEVSRSGLEIAISAATVAMSLPVALPIPM